jgi:hypothetical protein
MKPLSLRRRKVRALRIFKHPAFRRNLPTPAVANEAINFLKTKLTDGLSFYRITEELNDPRASTTVRLFKFKGHEFAIKNTQGSWFQGHSKDSVKNNQIREFIKIHHEYFRKEGLRKKKSYILRTPKLYGVIGNFLVLEKVTRWVPKTKSEIMAYQDAFSEMSSVFQNLAASNKNLPKPQVHDFIPVGMHNGKVVFQTVYDYF